MTDTALVCPRCQGSMTTFERAGVSIDQCDRCRGIFLDRGELERLEELETNRYPAPPPPQAYPQQGYPPQPSYGYDQSYGHHGHHDEHHSRGHGLFRELFD